MTHELLKRLAALRGINPRLNSVTDQVTEIVRSVEKALVEDLKIGIDASEWFLSEPAGETGVTREQYLAFSRVGSAGYRINVTILTVRHSPKDDGEPAGATRTLNEERILWASCNRELKLKACEKLPKLLDNIIKSAEGLLKTAEETATTIKEMLGDSQPVAQPKEREEPAKRSWFGRSRRRTYSVEDAVRAHRQYFIDQGVDEAALYALTSNGWVETGPNEFLCADNNGAERCSVVFIDEEGSAEVTFHGGETETVTIEDE
jgi:hypothetical protein